MSRGEDSMKEFIFFADCNSTYSLKVKASSIEEAKKIAEESDGEDWELDCHGKWHIDHDLTEEIEPSGEAVR